MVGARVVLKYQNAAYETDIVVVRVHNEYSYVEIVIQLLILSKHVFQLIFIAIISIKKTVVFLYLFQ